MLQGLHVLRQVKVHTHHGCARGVWVDKDHLPDICYWRQRKELASAIVSPLLTLAIHPGALCLTPMTRSVLISPDGSNDRSTVSTETTCVAYGFGYFLCS